jgi:hypothetical protein
MRLIDRDITQTWYELRTRGPDWALPSCLRIVKAEKGFTNKRTQNGKLPDKKAVQG